MGLLYDANRDVELIGERQKCKELLYDYNLLRPSDIERRKELITRLLGATGHNCVIGAGSVVCRDIPTNSLAVDNPCHVIREL
ncbi:MAG: maltose acetyltransferase domain-containing protein [Prevotella sp.]